jgi:DNA gyrase/topoisomerase IV subunit B
MKPPRIPSIFKLTEHNQAKRFQYTPRTYDEQKEKLEKRKREIEKEIDREKRLGTNYEQHLRERINDSWSRREMRRQQRNSSRRLLLILAGILILLYFIYKKIDLLP